MTWTNVRSGDANRSNDASVRLRSIPARRARTRTMTIAIVNRTWAATIVCRPVPIVGGAPEAGAPPRGTRAMG